ncbi:MAG: hypothetical protein BroJett022_21000 [Actinomycetes bacterium]|nr:MAG: hypothetical protein BroJett022_21000 [Actinomycetes bacterium]
MTPIASIRLMRAHRPAAKRPSERTGRGPGGLERSRVGKRNGTGG